MTGGPKSPHVVDCASEEKEDTQHVELRDALFATSKRHCVDQDDSQEEFPDDSELCLDVALPFKQTCPRLRCRDLLDALGGYAGAEAKKPRRQQFDQSQCAEEYASASLLGHYQAVEVAEL